MFEGGRRMRNVDASGLLDVWETGHALSPPRRALALLAHAHPHTSSEGLRNLSLGQRDALLRALRIALFGRELAFVASCPQCTGVLESALDLAQMEPAAPVQAQQVEIERCRVSVHAPTLGDLLGLPDDADAARRMLARRCLETSGDAAENLAPALSEESLAEIGAAMSAADPAALTEIELECPDCATRWLSGFDIASFLWREIDAWARRTLREVHALARAYAWSERDVLALSPTRRQLYLELSSA